MFRAFRSAEGEHLILDDNAFIEVVMPKSILRSLSDTEMDAYREPFRERDSRLPMLAWPRELPIDGEPADVVATVNDYGAWLARSPIPKLFIAGDPGAMLIGPARDFCEHMATPAEGHGAWHPLPARGLPDRNRSRHCSVHQGSARMTTSTRSAVQPWRKNHAADETGIDGNATSDG